MRHTVKVLSYILISSIVTSLVFASDKKTEEELFKNKQIEKISFESDFNYTIEGITRPEWNPINNKIAFIGNNGFSSKFHVI